MCRHRRVDVTVSHSCFLWHHILWQADYPVLLGNELRVDKSGSVQAMSWQPSLSCAGTGWSLRLKCPVSGIQTQLTLPPPCMHAAEYGRLRMLKVMRLEAERLIMGAGVAQ